MKLHVIEGPGSGKARMAGKGGTSRMIAAPEQPQACARVLRDQSKIRESEGTQMISIEEYSMIISELLDEFPPEFFRKLSGGVIVSEATEIPEYALGNDLYTLGVYRVSSGIRQIVMYKGSFDRVYPQADTAEAKKLLRGVLRHEFRHHLESLGGIHNASSLEAEDRRRKQAYLSGRGS